MSSFVTNSRDFNPIVQLSIYAENKVGKLNDIVALLAQGQVHVMAMCTLDTTDSALIRLIVDDCDKAKTLLKDHSFTFNVTTVIAVEIADESKLHQVTCSLLQAEINLHYIYPFLMRPEGKTGMVLHLEDNDLAASVLSRNGIKVLSQSDITR